MPGPVPVHYSRRELPPRRTTEGMAPEREEEVSVIALRVCFPEVLGVLSGLF